MVKTAYDLGTAYDISRKELVFCDAEDPVRKVGEKFYKKGIGSMIVVSGDQYAGFVTDDAIFKAVAEGLDLRSAKVGDLELDPLFTIRREAPLSEVSALFAKTRTTRLGVVDDEGKIVAVVKKKTLHLLDRFSFVDRMFDR